MAGITATIGVLVAAMLMAVPASRASAQSPARAATTSAMTGPAQNGGNPRQPSPAKPGAVVFPAPGKSAAARAASAKAARGQASQELTATGLAAVRPKTALAANATGVLKSRTARKLAVQPALSAVSAQSRSAAAQVSTAPSAAIRAERSSAAVAASLPGTPDASLDSMWNNYADNATCGDWSGGDGTSSVQLPDGEQAWFFSDTFLGSPTARKTLFTTSAIHNSIVVQNGSSLSTITGGNTCQETNTSLSFWDRYANPTAPLAGGFWWTGDQMIVGSNIIKFYYSGNSSVYPFAITGTGVSAIPISSVENDSTIGITPQSFTSLCSDSAASNIIWGSALLSYGGYVYVYGWSTTNSTQLYLAQTTASNLMNPSTWATYAGLDGSGNPIWSSCGQVETPLPITLGSGLSVSAINGSLWLVQEDPGVGLVPGPITAHPAAEPWLFDNSEVVLYDEPEASHDYPYYYLVYGATVEPGLGGSDDVVISYNVNSTSVDTGCVSADVHDASIYIPRFIDVPTSAFSTSALTAAATPSSVRGLAAPAYGIQNYGPTDPAPAPAENAAATPALPASAGSIDGVTDWYDTWGPLDGACPATGAPSGLSVSATPDGLVTLTWPTVGTDVWFYGYQENVTTGSGLSQMWGGLWIEPSSPTATTATAQALPVTSSSVNGDEFGWQIEPFGAQSTQPVGPGSPIATYVVTIAVPSAPTGVTASSGPAEAEFTINWNDVSYPSSSVLYWVYYWDITAGQTEADALQAALPAGPGATTATFQGLTSTNTFSLAPESTYGFYVTADNLGGNSAPSNAATAGPVDEPRDLGQDTDTAAAEALPWYEFWRPFHDTAVVTAAAEIQANNSQCQVVTENGVPGGSVSGNFGWADIVLWCASEVQVWEVKHKGDGAEAAGPAQLASYLTALTKKLESTGDYRPVAAGAPLGTTLGPTPVPGWAGLVTVMDGTQRGMLVYTVSEGPIPEPLPNPVPAPQPVPNEVPGWVTDRPLWGGLGVAAGIVIGVTLVDIEAVVGWVLDTIGVIVLF